MALLVFAVAILIGTAQERTVNTLKQGTQHVKRWSGTILLLVGAWLIALAIWADFFTGLFPV